MLSNTHDTDIRKELIYFLNILHSALLLNQGSA